MYISSTPLSKERSYFELELISLGVPKVEAGAAGGGPGGGGPGGGGVGQGGPFIGLCSHRYPLDLLPGKPLISTLSFINRFIEIKKLIMYNFSVFDLCLYPLFISNS